MQYSCQELFKFENSGCRFSRTLCQPGWPRLSLVWFPSWMCLFCHLSSYENDTTEAHNIPHYVSTDCMMRSTCLRFVSYTNIITTHVYYVAGLFIVAQYLQDTDKQTKPIAIMILGRCVRCCSELFIALYKNEPFFSHYSSEYIFKPYG